MQTTHNGVPIRVAADSAGQFTATWLNPDQPGDKPYWALAGQGYGYPTEEAALAACRETVERMAGHLVAVVLVPSGSEFGIGRIPADDPNPADTGPSMREVRNALRGPQMDENHEGPCEHAGCRRTGNWVSGAGRFLCQRHEDSY